MILFSYFWASSMMHQLRLLTHCDAGDPLGNGLTKMGKGFLSFLATPVELLALEKAVVKANCGIPCYHPAS